MIIINIKITNNCNLNCHYCFERNMNFFETINNEKYLNHSQLSNLLSIVNTPEIKGVVITGGEPTISEFFYPIVELFKNKKIYILTNGIRRIEKSILNNLEIIVSVDGDQKVMEKNRLINSYVYNQLLQNIEYYVRYAKNVGIASLITKNRTIYDCVSLFEHFKNNAYFKINIPSIYFSPPEICLSSYDMRNLMNDIENVIESYNFKLNLTHSLMDLCFVKNNLKTIAKNIQIFEYDLINNTFRSNDKFYKTLDEMLNDQNSQLLRIEHILEEELKYVHDEIIEPYNILERAVFEKKYEKK